MKKILSTKMLLIISAILIVSGGVLACSGMMMGGNPFFALAYNHESRQLELLSDTTIQKRELEKTKLEKFDSIEVKVDYVDVIFEMGDDYYIEYATYENNLDYTLIDGVLRFKYNAIPDSGYTQIMGTMGINFGYGESEKDYVKIYYPADAKLSRVAVSADSGKITIPGGNIQDLSIDTDYGTTKINKVDAGTIICKNTSGTLAIEDTKADSVQLKTDYTRIALDNIETSELIVTSESGKCTFDNITADVTEIYTEYGSVMLGLTGFEDDYYFDINTEYGSVRINDLKISSGYSASSRGDKLVKIRGESTNIKVETN